MDEVSTVAPPEPPQPPPPAPPQAPMPPHGSADRRPMGGGATAGVVLILVGGLLLAMRFTPFFSWWNLWPLIIIVAGLVQAFTPGREGWSVARMFDGFVTVAFGGVFLAITSGVVGWDVWARILPLWPILIISIGLEMLGKALHSSWPKVIGSLAIIAALAYAVFFPNGDLTGGVFGVTVTGGVEVDVSEPVGSIDAADLTLDAGVATVRMGSGSQLLSIDGRSPWGQPEVDVDRSSSPAKVDVNLGDADQTTVLPGNRSATYDVEIARDVTWDLRVNTGVSEFDADLSDLDIASLDLRPGVASCEVVLGDVPVGIDEATADVRAGVSSVVLKVPDDVEARVEIESGLSGNTVRGDFEKRGGGVWETPDYDSAKAAGRPVWLLRIKSGIGSITIDTY